MFYSFIQKRRKKREREKEKRGKRKKEECLKNIRPIEFAGHLLPCCCKRSHDKKDKK